MGLFLFCVSFWAGMIFPILIHSGISISSKHLFISKAGLSWIGVTLLKPESTYYIMPCYFPVWYFIECCSEGIKEYFRLGVFFFLILVTLFPYCLSNQLFCYILFVPIFSSKCVFSFPCVLLLAYLREFFFYFQVEFSFTFLECSFFFVCIIWSYLCIFLVSLLLPVPSDLSPQVVFVLLAVLFFLFIPASFCVFLFLFLSILLIVVDFLSVFQSYFSSRFSISFRVL